MKIQVYNGNKYTTTDTFDENGIIIIPGLKSSGGLGASVFPVNLYTGETSVGDYNTSTNITIDINDNQNIKMIGAVSSPSSELSVIAGTNLATLTFSNVSGLNYISFICGQFDNTLYGVVNFYTEEIEIWYNIQINIDTLEVSMNRLNLDASTNNYSIENTTISDLSDSIFLLNTNIETINNTIINLQDDTTDLVTDMSVLTTDVSNLIANVSDLINDNTEHSTNIAELYNEISNRVSNSALLDLTHPIGDIIATETNTNPTSTLGGTWTLIDKSFKSEGMVSFLDDVTAGSATIADARVGRSGHQLEFRFGFTPTSWTGTNTVILTFPMSAVGLQTFAYNRFHVGICDGGATLSFCKLVDDSTAKTISLQAVDYVSRSSSPSTTATYISIPAYVPMSAMLDDFCDKFFWKRTA